MKGWIKYNDLQEANDLINNINNCMNLENPMTWDSPRSFCSLDSNSASTIFWGYVVKVDTDQMGQCLTQSEIDSIIQIPEDCNICES